MKHQKGFSLLSTLFVVVVLGAAVVVGLKVMPVYNENAEIRQLLKSLSTKTGEGESSLRRQFDQGAAVADIASVKGGDVAIVEGNSSNYLHVSYTREVPLVSNISLLFKFDNEAGKQSAQ